MLRTKPGKALLALTGLAVAAFSTGAAQAEERILVTLDHAKILRLEGEASTVILGNPAIADATVFNKSMLVITGKSYGSTNLVILDEEGQEISVNTISVKAADDRLVTVHRGNARKSYECAPNCQPSLVIGDEATSFEAINTQISNRIAISEGDTD